jgi:hypothetical protein
LREKLLESSDSATTNSRKVSAIKFTYFSIAGLEFLAYNRNALSERKRRKIIFEFSVTS